MQVQLKCQKREEHKMKKLHSIIKRTVDIYIKQLNKKKDREDFEEKLKQLTSELDNIKSEYGAYTFDEWWEKQRTLEKEIINLKVLINQEMKDALTQPLTTKKTW